MGGYAGHRPLLGPLGTEHLLYMHRNRRDWNTKAATAKRKTNDNYELHDDGWWLASGRKEYNEKLDLTFCIGSRPTLT